MFDATSRRSMPLAGAGRLWLAVALVLAGATLIALTIGGRVSARLGSQAGLEQFRQATAAPSASARAAAAAVPAVASAPDISTWAAGRIAAWRASMAHDLGPPLAVLRIRRLDLEVPVWRGIDELTLDRGLGQIPGTSLPGGPGNIGLAGHRDGFFRVLEGIAAGDEVELETTSGVQRFAVTDTWIVDTRAMWVLEPTAHTSLTLVTCYPFYFVGKAPSRFIVRARATGGGRLPEQWERGDGAATVARERGAL